MTQRPPGLPSPCTHQLQGAGAPLRPTPTPPLPTRGQGTAVLVQGEVRRAATPRTDDQAQPMGQGPRGRRLGLHHTHGTSTRTGHRLKQGGRSVRAPQGPSSSSSNSSHRLAGGAAASAPATALGDMARTAILRWMFVGYACVERGGARLPKLMNVSRTLLFLCLRYEHLCSFVTQQAVDARRPCSLQPYILAWLKASKRARATVVVWMGLTPWPGPWAASGQNGSILQACPSHTNGCGRQHWCCWAYAGQAYMLRVRVLVQRIAARPHSRMQRLLQG